MPAPSAPANTPAETQRPRPLTPRVAASTMPMISPASITSRKTMMSAPNIRYSAMTTPLAVFGWNSPKNS